MNNGSSDSDDDPKDMGGRGTDAGPNQIEQLPDVQPDSGSINDLGLILRRTMTDSELSQALLLDRSTLC